MSALTPAEKVAAFKAATRCLEEYYAKEIQTGMTDAEIRTALERCFGIYSGSGGPGQFSISRQGAGLKLWVSHEAHNRVTMKPTWQGQATIDMARSVYGIADPEDDQMRLL